LQQIKKFEAEKAKRQPNNPKNKKPAGMADKNDQAKAKNVINPENSELAP
jgi:hypothetical protein